MYKIIDLGHEVPETGEPRVQLVNPELVKTASTEIQQFWDTLRQDDGSAYLWVIGVSAMEYYGCNNNGDAFAEAELKNTHERFTSNANVFLQHVNKDPAKGIGKPVFSWYNDAMHRVELVLKIDKTKPAAAETVRKIRAGEPIFVSMGCFPAGTPVMLANGREKPIEDVLPDDVVVTHTGAQRKVTSRMAFPYSGKAYAITYAGHTEKLVATEEHPILVRRYGCVPESGEGDCPVCGRHVRQVATHLRRKKDDAHEAYMNDVDAALLKYDELWVKASDIRVGDYVLTPVTRTETEERNMSPAFARLLGYFAAEGSYVKYNGRRTAIQLNFNSNETDLHKDVLECLEELSSKKPTYQIRENKHLGVISLYDADLAEKVYSHIGEYSHSKYVSNEIRQWSDGNKLNFIGAYVDGDGSYSKIHKTLTFSTISKNLALGVENLAASVGITMRVSSRLVNGRKYEAYTGDMNRNGLESLVGHCGKAKLVKFANEWRRRGIGLNDVFIDGGYVCRRVKAVAETDFSDVMVYNLSVEGDESFVAENIAVHNCTVAFDQCSICGNRAKTRKDYCDHLRYNMKKILPDGRQVYALNPDPKFFDISIVAKPADPTAFTLDKMASTQFSKFAEVGRTSAELGEEAEDISLKLAALRKVSDIVKQVDGHVVDAMDPSVEAARNVAEHGFEDFGYPEMPYSSLGAISPAGFLSCMRELDAPVTLDDAAWMAGRSVLGRCPTHREMGSMFSMLPSALSALMDRPGIFDKVLSPIISSYGGEFDNPHCRTLTIRIMRPVAQVRISIVRGLAPSGMLEKIGARIDGHEHNFRTVRVRDEHGIESLTAPYFIDQAETAERPGKILRGVATAGLSLGALAALLTEPTLARKLVGAAIFGVPALAVSRMGGPSVSDRKIQTVDWQEVPSRTLMESWKFQKTGSLSSGGFLGMAVPAAMALDYAHGLWKYADARRNGQ